MEGLTLNGVSPSKEQLETLKAVDDQAQLATQHNLWYNTTGLGAIAKNRTEI